MTRADVDFFISHNLEAVDTFAARAQVTPLNAARAMIASGQFGWAMLPPRRQVRLAQRIQFLDPTGTQLAP